MKSAKVFLCVLVFIAVAGNGKLFAQFTGGSNDGFGNSYQCALTLAGTSPFALGPVIGSSTFCNLATETYRINVSGATVNTTYTWSVPAGAVITSGQGTTTILVTFGSTNGNVSVNVANDCQTLNAFLPVSSTTCTFYAGGVNDGFTTLTNCATNLNGGTVFIPGPIVGSTTFCNFATEAYSITVGGITSTTVYNWTVPAGATITSGQGTNSILVTFGNTSGNVSVDISNACQTLNAFLPVATTNCIFYAGGSNDGFSNFTDCATNLNGGSVFIPGPIMGSTTFCNFATEIYSITVAGITSTTVYNWSVPAGASITSGQGTNSILVTFGNTGGNISVDISNACQTINVAQAVVTTNCIFYAGGVNDGFSDQVACATNLNGGSVFIPGPIVGSTTFCNFATELYSITVGGATSLTGYNWTVPPGATITSGQGTNSVLVTFGNTSGNIAVDVSNVCQTINVSQALVAANCIFYAGGSNDGFSNITACASNLNGGTAFLPGPIVGSTTFCNFASDVYSITVAGATSTTVYNWTVPPGATITSGQGTTSILVAFGNTSGNVSIDITNACQTINVALPVTAANCIFYAGGVNDGFSFFSTCISSLAGGSGFVAGPVTGSSTFCNFGTEGYSIVVAGSTASTVYTWTVPAGATITTGQGTPAILVTFGSTGGNVSVTATDACLNVVSASLPVSSTSCTYYTGGPNDGFSVTLVSNIPLPIQLSLFEATVVENKVELKWVTESEINNQYFTVERSADGEDFESVKTVKGAGNSLVRREYHAEDSYPLRGKSYYRLAQTDFDGKVTRSWVVMVNVDSDRNGMISLYPNPFSKLQTVTLVYGSKKNGLLMMTVIDNSGKTILTDSRDIHAGENELQLALPLEASGIYILQLQGPEKIEHVRIALQ